MQKILSALLIIGFTCAPFAGAAQTTSGSYDVVAVGYVSHHHRVASGDSSRITYSFDLVITDLGRVGISREEMFNHIYPGDSLAGLTYCGTSFSDTLENQYMCSVFLSHDSLSPWDWHVAFPVWGVGVFKKINLAEEICDTVYWHPLHDVNDGYWEMTHRGKWDVDKIYGRDGTLYIKMISKERHGRERFRYWSYYDGKKSYVTRSWTTRRGLEITCVLWDQERRCLRFEFDREKKD